jgi:hypothetical protein
LTYSNLVKHREDENITTMIRSKKRKKTAIRRSPAFFRFREGLASRKLIWRREAEKKKKKLLAYARGGFGQHF